MRGRRILMSPYARAWRGVFFTTMAAVAFDAVVVLIVYEMNRANGFRLAGFYGAGALLGVVTTIASAFGATMCARIVSGRPLSRTLPMLFLLVAVAGLLSGLVILVAPVPIVVTPSMVMGAQLIAARVALFVKKEAAPVRGERRAPCANCGHSLAGLSRATTVLCPECGGRIG